MQSIEDGLEYLKLVEDPNGIYKDSPQRGSSQHQIYFLSSMININPISPSQAAHAPVNDAALNMLLACLKYAQGPENIEIAILACLAIKHLTRKHIHARDISSVLTSRKVMIYIADTLSNMIRDAKQQNESSRYSPNDPRRIQHIMDRRKLFQAICGAVHSVCYHINKGQILSNFSHFVQRDLIDFIFQGIRIVEDENPEASYADAVSYLECIWALLNLCYINSENQAYIAEEHNGIPFVVDVMFLYPNFAELQEKGAGALRNLADRVENRAIIASSRGVSKLLLCIDLFPSNVNIQINSMGALRNLSADPSAQDIIANHGGVKQIFHALNIQRDCSIIVEFALETIANLAKNEKFLRDRMEDSEFVDIVLSVLEFNSWEFRIVSEGIAVLRYLSVSSALELLISRKGGLEIILQSMRRFPDHVLLQERCCQALLVLSMHERNQVSMVKKGILGRILRSMQMYDKNRRIHEDCVGILLNLTVKEAIQDRIAKKGGLARILKSMELFPSSKLLQERSCAALAVMTMDMARRNYLTRKGGLGQILEVMKYHMDSPTVQQYGADILANLALNAYNQIQVVHKEGIELLVRSIRNHLDHCAVLERCLAAFWNLSVHSQNQERIAQRCGLEAVVDAMRAQMGNRGVQQTGCGALRNLSLNRKFNFCIVVTFECLSRGEPGPFEEFGSNSSSVGIHENTPASIDFAARSLWGCRSLGSE
eukprot:TRINITY_DN936_c0_g1_i3.p1 TRINITY_DN936_c0_g1~~TRINITY_DN936_c0_g1_i3.p1  ORF type:complete len:713 (+),score=180.91 TRINITY_DN936_c0_g1_i3:70-2208(+)